MRTNVANKNRLRTYEGAPAKNISDEQALRRTVLSCLLGETEFYEDGQLIKDRIRELAAGVPAATLAGLAIEARETMKLRHVPLVLLSVLAKNHRGALVGDTIARVVQRADEPAELLAIHAETNGVGPDKVKSKVSAQMKRGLSLALTRFDAYQLAKYDRAGAIRLRDVLFMVHAKPKDERQEAVFKQLVDGQLATPDTWETNLSAGKDKGQTFERLLREGKLGYLALLRNLRNMAEAGVDRKLIQDAIIARKGAGRVLPFRYTAAARHAPSFEPVLDAALLEAIAEMPLLTGRTAILVDVSYSMSAPLSRKSDLTRLDAAATLAAVVHGEDLRVFSFSNDLVEVPARRGMAGVDAVKLSQPYGGTYLGKAVKTLNRMGFDRLIVVTDEQSHDRVPDPRVNGTAYMINVASAMNGVGYGPWVHVDGFSENILRFITEYEAAQ